jgi:myo-inositol-1(or 4)-monophosphatase
MAEFWYRVLDFCKTTTEELGHRLMRDFGHVSADRKSDGSLVTESDRWCDREIRRAIAATFPDHGILTEETTHTLPDRDWCWVIDPIDGTTNFTRGIPVWGISLGLLYRGTPVFGFLNFPPLRQVFYGYWSGQTNLIMPKGAYLNGKPIHTSPDEPSFNHLFNFCARSMDILKNPFPCKFRSIGVASYNLALVACGASLGGVEATPKIWDIAAVWAILQGAGGAFVHLEPNPVFPLKIGKDYGSRPFPSLALSRIELSPIFKPLVGFIGDRVVRQYGI